MAYNELLNPEKIKRFVFEVRHGNKFITGTEEIDFNLSDWVDESLFKYFNYLEITKAIKDLGLCFSDLTMFDNSNVKYYHSWSEKNYFMFPEKHAIKYSYKNKTDYVKVNGLQTTKQYDEHVVLIKNPYSSGLVLTQLLINKFEFLKHDMFWNETPKSINVRDYVNSNNVMMNFPKELRYMTIENIINYPYPEINYIERKSKLVVYSDLKTIYFNPYDGSERKDKMSMYMPLDAFMNKDWKTIEDNTRTAHTSYYSSFKNLHGDYKKDLEDLIYNPIVLCLKIDLLKSL